MKPAKRLASIEGRLADNRLTPAPWAATGQGGVQRGRVDIFHAAQAQGARHAGSAGPDADFTAAARDDVPWLLARVKQLETALRTLPLNRSRSAMAALAQDALDRDPIDDIEE